MAIKRIQLRGISHSPSDNMSADGGCDESINFFLNQDELAPMDKMLAVSADIIPHSIEGIMEIVFIHKTSSYKHTIHALHSTYGIYNAGLYYIVRSGTDPNYSYVWNLIMSFNSGEELKKIEAIGNTLIVLTNQRKEFILFKEGEYSDIGNNFPEIKLGISKTDVTISDSIKQGFYYKNHDSSESDYSTYIEVATKMVGRSWRTGQTEFTEIDANSFNEKQTAIFKDIIGVVKRKEEEKSTIANNTYNALIRPVFIRYAYKLYDGSTYVMHSAPILIDPNDFIENMAVMKMFFNFSNISEGKSLRFTIKDNYSDDAKNVYLAYQLLFTINNTFNELQKWNDIIDSVEIFTTPTISKFKYEFLRTTNPVYNSQDKIGYCEFEYKRYNDAELIDYISSNSNFYKIKSIQFDEYLNKISAGGSELTFGIDNYKIYNDGTLYTQETLPDDTTNSLRTILPGFIYSFNERLLMSDVKERYPNGYYQLPSKDYTNVTPVIRYTTDGSEPTSSSTIYTEPFYVPNNTTVKAKAFYGDTASVLAGMLCSNYYPTPPIMINEDGKVTITIPANATKVTYTTDGSEPTDSSTEYTGNFIVAEGTTVKAKAFYPGSSSVINVKAYTSFSSYISPTIEITNAGIVTLSVPSKSQYTIFSYCHTQNGEEISQVRQYQVGDNPGAWLFYPEQRCKKAKIYRKNCNNDWFVTEVNMREDDYLNGACYFAGWGAGKTLWKGTATTEPSLNNINPYSVRHNSMYQTVSSNPFAIEMYKDFPSEIIGMSIITAPLSQGQFGYADLYVFTEDGIYTLAATADGSLGAHKYLSSSVAFAGTICQLEQAIAFVSSRGLMLLVGSQIRCLSDKMASRSFIPTQLDGLATLLENDNDYKIMNDAAMDTMSFFEFIKDCVTVHDVAGNRILMFKKFETGNVKGYCYVYDFTTDSFSKCLTPRDAAGTDVFNFSRSINSYPNAVVTFKKTNGGFYTASCNQSNSHSRGGALSVNRGLLITRSLNLDDTYARKRINAIRIRGIWVTDTSAYSSSVQYILYGSMDGNTWARVTSLHGSSCKFYRIVVLSTLKPWDRISWIDVDYSVTMGGRIM